jgi:uncharacterized membrane protein YqiK
MFQVPLALFLSGIVAGVALLLWLSGTRYIPHNRVGIVEKMWSFGGSLKDGEIIALAGQAGYQADVLRGGIHLFFYPWQYRIHKVPLVTISESRIAYVYARDGQPLEPNQTLGRIVQCQNFQDAGAFLRANGQRGRQRGILREGVYAINSALFVVIAENAVLAGPIDGEIAKYASWQSQLAAVDGFRPVVIGHGARQMMRAVASEPGQEAPAEENNSQKPGPLDTIGVVTVADGPPIRSSELIAPEVKSVDGERHHDYFQDPEAFLALGGCRGKQLQVLTDGTFFINRWFASVEMKPKTLIPIGYVGVVVSFHGTHGEDLTGEQFRYGEQVEPGQRGVWKRALPPGKYALNPYAMKVEYVPTINFVLRWITGSVEAHQYDKDLTSIELITADGYEPLLPLSLVLHIDYEKAPRVVQRFGDVNRLITQTLDPILSAYFRDVAQSSHMLELLTRREDIQARATEELRRRFQEYDINCIAVLIGRPESSPAARKNGADPIDKLFDQLRIRRLAKEQVETFRTQEEAAMKLRELNEAQAAAAKQSELTQTRVDVDIAANRGEAQLAEARRLADRDVVRAEGEGRARELVGHGEAARVAQVGLAEASVSLKKVQAFGDPRLYALQGVSEKLSASTHPLVPQRLMVFQGGGAGDHNAELTGATSGLFGTLLALLVAERSGMPVNVAADELKELEAFAAQQQKAAAQPSGKAVRPSPSETGDVMGSTTACSA